MLQDTDDSKPSVKTAKGTHVPLFEETASHQMATSTADGSVIFRKYFHLFYISIA